MSTLKIQDMTGLEVLGAIMDGRIPHPSMARWGSASLT